MHKYALIKSMWFMLLILVYPLGFYLKNFFFKQSLQFCVDIINGKQL